MKRLSIIIFVMLLSCLAFAAVPTIDDVGGSHTPGGGASTQNVQAESKIYVRANTSDVETGHTLTNVSHDGSTTGSIYVYYWSQIPNSGYTGYLDYDQLSISNFTNSSNNYCTFDVTLPSASSINGSTTHISFKFGLVQTNNPPDPFIDDFGDRAASVIDVNSTPTNYYTYMFYGYADPTLTSPATSGVDNSSLSIDFDIPAASNDQSVILTFTRTSGTTDSYSPHEIVMTNEYGDHNYSGTYTITSGTGFTSPSHADLTIDTGASSNHNKPLVNGTVYTVKCEYTPYGGSTAESVVNTGFIYDTSTQSPTLDLPSTNQTIKQSFTIQYDQPETAYEGSVKITFTRTTGTADSGSPHILIVDSEAIAEDEELTINGGNLDGSTGVSLAAGGGGNSLVNGTTYTVKFEYQDIAQNIAASDQNSGVKYDNATVAPTLDTPTADQTVAQNFTVQYDQPETAYASTVKLTFTWTGGSTDTTSPHVLEITSEVLGTDKTLTINGSNLSNSTGISSVTGGNALVNGTVYTVKIEYQDEAQNTVASDDNTGITYDTSTETPTLDSPTANQSIGQSFTVQYDQPETAYNSTVKLSFTHTAGTADSNSPHVLEVDSETSGNNKTLSLDGSDLNGSSGVSLLSGANLVDDAIYTIKIEYQDLAQNTVASDQNAVITYDTSGLLLVSGSDYNVGESFQPDTDNNAFFILELQKSTSGGTVTVDEIEFDLTGSFDNSDIGAIKVWRSTDNSFSSSSDTQLVSDTSSPYDPFVANFTPDESISTTKTYYFLTVDVSSSASGSDNLGAQINAASDITADLTVSGTFPISGDDHPLPVTLSSFEVQLQGREPKLIWITQSETNNAFWNIYRSDSGNLSQAFQMNTNNTISGQGTTSTPTDYIFTDNYPVEANTTYWYWLESIAYNGTSEIMGPVAITINYNGGSAIPEAPVIYGLQQNYPNPFNPSTSISFILPYNSEVKLAIYNIKGEKVSTIYEGLIEAEIEHTFLWSGLNKSGNPMPTGLYIFQLKTNEENFYRKMNLIK
jgi:flagellar hook capping protein FlgD